MKPQHFTIHSPNEYEISCMEWLPSAAAAGADMHGAAAKESSGPLPTLLCLHGFAGDKYSTVIEAVAKDRCRAGFRCVTFDWPGHGDSTADSSMLTIENCLADLDAVVKHLRPAARGGRTPSQVYGCFLFPQRFRRHGCSPFRQHSGSALLLCHELRRLSRHARLPASSGAL